MMDGARSKKKVQKIIDWPTPKSIKDARAFIGIVVYYWIFIRRFAVTVVPIFELFRKVVGPREFVSDRVRWKDSARQI